MKETGRLEAAAGARVALRPFGRLAVCLLSLLLVGGTGCSWQSYDRITLGMPITDLQRRLPQGNVRRTALGYVVQRKVRRPDDVSILLLITEPGGAVAAKFDVVYRTDARWGEDPPGYFLKGRFSLAALGLADTGPADALRAIAIDLAGYEDMNVIRLAQAWVVAGIERLLEQVPDAAPAAVDVRAVAEVLPRVPAGGAPVLEVDDQGVVVCAYRAPAEETDTQRKRWWWPWGE